MTKVLIIRFSSIGDIVLTSPVVRNLKRQMHGGVELHYLTKKAFAQLLIHSPYIDKVFAITKSTNEVMKQLREEHYDYIIDLHGNLRSRRVVSGLKVLDFRFRKHNLAKWLLVNFGINRLPEVHIVDRYMDTLKAFGITNDGEGLDYFLPENGLPDRAQLPTTHAKGYIALAIGAAHWRKRLRETQYIELCKHLDYSIVLLGGPNEKAMGERISQSTGGKVLNLAGNCSLHASAWYVKHSELVITPDTGLMHIAAAFKKPIISLWAATVPAFGMSPYLNEALDVRIEATHLRKRPCSKLGNRCKYKECRCVDEMPLSEIWQTAHQALYNTDTVEQN